MLSAGVFECLTGLYWWLSFSLLPYFGEPTDLILIFGGLVPLGLAWVALRLPIFAACSAFLIYAVSLVYLYWPGFGVVATGRIEYFLHGVPLCLLMVAVITAFRPQIATPAPPEPDSSAAVIKRRKSIVRALAVCAVLYVSSYAILSFLGGYRLVETGHYRPITWMSMGDVFVWQPRFGMCYPFDTIGGDHIHRYDTIGAYYLPLICLDQRYVHRSRPFVTAEPGGGFTHHPFPDIALMHPIAQRAILIADQIAAKYKPELDAARACNDKKEIIRIETAKWKQLEQQIGK